MISLALSRELFLHAKIDIKDFELAVSDELRLELASYGHGFKMLDVGKIRSSMPILWQWFDMVNTYPTRICYINVPANSSQQIHIDIGPRDLGLNIPIAGCLGAYTRMFQNNGQLVTSYTKKTNLPFNRYIDENPIELSRFVLGSPTLINIKVPHQVVNDSNTDRICLSFRFDPDPWHLIDDVTFFQNGGINDKN